MVDILFRKPCVRRARIRLGLYVKLTFLTLSMGIGHDYKLGGAVFQMQDRIVKLSAPVDQRKGSATAQGPQFAYDAPKAPLKHPQLGEKRPLLFSA